jgi:hypothetical protein
MNRRQLLFAAILLASVAYLAGLVHYAKVRPIDGDEGFYTTAARLVWEGKVPYRDFFFQQAPLLPYLYSWIWAVHPQSLVAMRMFSAACGGLAVFLWGICLLHVKRLPTKVALATFAVVLLNPYWVSWNVVVKTFAVANLLMSVATICLYVALHSERLRWYFIAGLALGACASARSLYGPVIPVVLLWLVYHEWRTTKLPYAKTLTLGGGATCGLLPMIVSFASGPSAFIFNNIQYHRLDKGYLWVNGQVIEGYQSVGHTAIVYFVNLFVHLLELHPYFTAEVVLAVIGADSVLQLSRKQSGQYSQEDYAYFQVAFLLLLAYTATALIPFPPYDQYFDSPLVPFLIPFVAEGLRVTIRPGRKWVVLLPVAAAVLFFVEIGTETGMNSGDPLWEMSHYREVAGIVEANSNPTDVVLSFWPGFVFESGRRYFPGLEDHFVYRIMSKISPEARAQYHVVSKDEIMKAISSGAVQVVVVHPWIAEYVQNLSPAEIQALGTTIVANYSLVSRVWGISVFRRRSPAARTTVLSPEVSAKLQPVSQ